MALLRPRAAADSLGVSYPTLKQWIYAGKIRSVKTAGGHHRIPQDEVERVLGDADRRRWRASRRPPPTRPDAAPGCNKLVGRVVEVRYEGPLARLTINVCGQAITSTVTSDAARSLIIENGVSVYALVKVTEVRVVRS